jgi:spermidine synthase
MRDRPVPINALLLLFVLSGAAGLIYEVVWARQLVLVFGNTSQAVSTILTGFFGGLAIGGAVGGRVADRVRRPLRLYGVMELIVVAVVLLTPVSFRLIGELYRGIYPSLSELPILLALVRFAFAILALAPATLLMGATLPTLTRFLAQGVRGIAGAFQRLYTANTLGAIIGTAMAGFVLIEMLGLTGALAVGAACSGTAGLVALILDRRSGESQGASEAVTADVVPVEPVPAAPEKVRGPAAEPVAHRRRLALTLAFVSGLTSLGYQVTWNRLLGAGTGSSTYVFTTILILFLIGIALGAGLLGTLRGRVRSTLALIAVAQVLTAAFALAGAVILASPSDPFYGATADFVKSLGRFAGQTTFIVLPATLAMGITFPATAALLGDETGSEGSATGSLLAVNTAGSLVATFVLPFFVIPMLGSPATLAGLALLNAAVGAALIVRAPRLSEAGRWIGAGAATGVALLVVLALVSGAAFQNPTIELIEKKGGTVFAATEDEIASVEAGQVGAMPQIWVAGTSMTLITVDTKFMPLLPLALRPDATRGATIAFGMGTAFRTSLKAGVTTDAVELVPSVPTMFHWFYDDADAVLANPAGKVIVADGRNHVELTESTYDFVIVDPPPPIESSGVSVISTVEFYRATKARLVQDGIMVQWVPYGQTLDEFLAHVRSFLAVFPNVRVIAGAGGYGFYMIGSEGSVDLNAEAIVEVLSRPGILDDVNEAPDSGNRSAQTWANLLTGLTWAAGDQLRNAVGDGPLITDDRPLPEYFIIRRLQDPDAPRLTLDGLRDLLK